MNEIQDIILESEYNVLNSLYEYYNKQYIMESYYMEDDNQQQVQGNQSLLQRFVAWCERAIAWIKSKLGKTQTTQQPVANKPDFTNIKNLIDNIPNNTNYSEELRNRYSELQTLLNSCITASEKSQSEFKVAMMNLTNKVDTLLFYANQHKLEADIKLCTDLTKDLTKLASAIITENNPSNSTNETNQTNTQANTQNNSNETTDEQKRLIQDVWAHNWKAPKNMPDGSHDIWSYIDRLNFNDAKAYVKPMLKDIDKRLNYLEGYNSSDNKVQSAIGQVKAFLKQNYRQLVDSANDRHTDADQAPLLENPYISQPGDNKMNPNNEAHAKHDMLTPYKQKQQNQGG